VVHGADKLAWALLPVLALALLLIDAVAGLRLGLRALLKEFLLFAALVPLMLLPRRPLLHLGRGRRGLLRLRLVLLRRLILHCPLRLRALVFAAAAAAAMALRLHRTVVRRRPQLGLGLRRFCRHAFTS
jgi:hypothetical protein